MKRILFKILLLSGIVITLISCRRIAEKVVEGSLDCLSENLLTSLTLKKSDTDPKTISFAVTYSGKNTLTSVEWDFGDGHKTTTTSNHTVTHTYEKAGSYAMRASVKINSKESECTSYHTKNVTIP